MVVAHCTNVVNSDNSETVIFKTEENAINDYAANISLYPNPTTGIITCDLREAGNISMVNVYDVFGRLLQTLQTNGDILTIDASNYADGLYFVRISTENGIINKTFIKK